MQIYRISLGRHTLDLYIPIGLTKCVQRNIGLRNLSYMCTSRNPHDVSLHNPTQADKPRLPPADSLESELWLQSLSLSYLISQMWRYFRDRNHHRNGRVSVRRQLTKLKCGKPIKLGVNFANEAANDADDRIDNVSRLFIQQLAEIGY